MAGMSRRQSLPEWAWIVFFVAGYIVLTQWLLPKLGVKT
jgi:hypothetical protein